MTTFAGRRRPVLGPGRAHVRRRRVPSPPRPRQRHGTAAPARHGPRRQSRDVATAARRPARPAAHQLRHTGHGRFQHAAATDVDAAARRRRRPPPRHPRVRHRRRARRVVGWRRGPAARHRPPPASPAPGARVHDGRRHRLAGAAVGAAPHDDAAALLLPLLLRGGGADDLRRAGPAGPELAARRGPAPAGPATELAGLRRAGAGHLDVHAPLPLLHRDQGARPSS